MEDKNKATQKVEEIVDEKKKTPSEQLKEEVQKSNKPSNKSVNAKKSTSSTQKKNKNSTANKKAVEKDKEQKRIAKAEMKQKKQELKAEKKKAHKEKNAAFKMAVKNKIEQFKLERLRKKEERKERRDLLKSESKADRIERKAHEKQAKRDLKIQKREQAALKREERANLRREKIRARRDLKAQKRKLALENKKDRRNHGIGGWLAAVISLGCSVIVLGTLFTLSLVKNYGGNDMFENTIERTFYDFVSYVDNMEVNMSKLLVSKDEQEQQRLLSDITVQANLASSDIGELPLKDEDRYYTAKFVNQVGDYSKYLNNKLIDGGEISASDWENLSNLYSINSSLKGELTTLSSKLGENYEFVSLLSDGGENVVLDRFKSMEESAVDYPKMIYDGPFSDSLDTATVKGLSGEEISMNEALDTFKSIFSNYAFDNAEVIGEVNGKIQCYAVEGKATDDTIVYAEISKVGGKLISSDCFANCHTVNNDLATCEKIAESFIKDLGIKGMKAVWATESDATVYMNFASEVNGVIVYPDMIKVTVCQERGVVSGFDATEYYLNHTSRTIGTAKITKQQAINNLSENIEVETIRLAVIPKGNSKEVLTYEISGKFNGSTYYVYIDCKTGHESQIFRVVETTEGTLLM